MKQTFILLLFSFYLQSCEEEPYPDELSEQNDEIKVLLQAKQFGFAGKKGQKERKTTKAYRLLLSNPDAKEHFKYLYEKGNTFSKLYALCGLKQTDEKMFEKLSKTLDGNKNVRTQHGCVSSDVRAGELINHIKKGYYKQNARVKNK
ncbi:MAG: hypothetical protein HRT89_03010 [Lentisphaeria bacterium]|nr:hypothetical protein [Lentisphaeria bacterium]NQZ67019.1 hypothetical protein [Lentisphaeria bacterium]